MPSVPKFLASFALVFWLAPVLAFVAQDASPAGDAAESEAPLERAAADRLDGRVLDGDGSPVAGATVRVIRDGLSMWGSGKSADDWVDPVLTTTDDDGAFSVTGLEPVQYRVRCEAPGLAPHNDTYDPGGDPIEARLELGDGLDGVVLDAASGKPLPGARQIYLS